MFDWLDTKLGAWGAVVTLAGIDAVLTYVKPIVGVAISVILGLVCGYLIWRAYRTKKQEVGTDGVAAPNELKDKLATSVGGIAPEIKQRYIKNEAEYPKLIESLNKARVGAETLIKLKADTVVANERLPRWAELKEIAKGYKDAIDALRGARRAAYSEEYKSKVDSLIKSLQRGKLLMAEYSRTKDMSLFKTELDANSEDIIRQIEDTWLIVDIWLS